jgi:hypothetical protein
MNVAIFSSPVNTVVSCNIADYLMCAMSNVHRWLPRLFVQNPHKLIACELE